MKIKPKRHIDYCVENILAQNLKFKNKEIAKGISTAIEDFVKTLIASNRFIIPNGRELLSDQFPRIEDYELENFHLPFKITALEYEYNNINRITLAVEIDSKDKLYNKYQIEGFVVIGFVKNKINWSICNMVALIDKNDLILEEYEGEEKNCVVNCLIPDLDQGETNLFTADNLPIESNIKFKMSIWDNSVLSHIDIKNDESIKKFVSDAYRAILIDVHVLLKFLSAYQCKNVEVEVLKRKQPLNIKRLRKFPIYDYRILKIGKTKKISSKDIKEDLDHAKRNSPRLHKRRGHSRVLRKTGTRYWVQPHMVGNLENGVIDKDYLWV